MITRQGIEGGAIYALSPDLRDDDRGGGRSACFMSICAPISVLPSWSGAWPAPREKQSLANWLRKQAKLTPVAIGLVQEAAHVAATPLSTMTPEDLAKLIKAVPIRLTGPRASPAPSPPPAASRSLKSTAASC